MRWPWQREQQPRDLLSISDPAVAALFDPFGPSIDGVSVNEFTAMGLSAMYRAVAVVAGTLATLPFRSLRKGAEDRPEATPSVFDDPDGPDGQTVFEWKQTAFAHLMIHGRCGAIKQLNEAGSVVRLPLVHPSCFHVVNPGPAVMDGQEPVGGVWFRVMLDDGRQVYYDARDFWYVPSLSLDGKRGVSLLAYARRSLATTIAGDKMTGNLFSKGAYIAGLATPDDEEDITDDVPEIRRQLDSAVGGVDNAGKIAVINRRLKFTPWQMTAIDAQILQQRQFQIEEIARWSGVPPHLLMQVDKQTSWGTGVEMQDRALGRTVLAPWATPFEQRASRLLARPRWCEFDFSGLERPSPEEEINLLVVQVNTGLLTLNEARAIRNLPPVDGGDVPRGVTGGPAPAPANPNGGGEGDPAAQ